MAQSSSCRIQSLQDIAQLRQCVEIQKLAWGFADEDVLPLRTLVLCAKIGGQVFGAVNAEGVVLGFLNSFLGLRDGQVYLHSQMMAVRPEHQNRGIGKRLKLAQREEALQRGITRIEWTFDPLEIRNARFNIELLGAICRRYLINIYGVTTSRLQGGMPTDRLVAEWYLNSPRVLRRLSSESFTTAQPSWEAVVEVPLNIGELKVLAPDEALTVQGQLRERMVQLFSQNLCITGFEINRDASKAAYLFRSAEHPEQLP
jgi:predicted GNAT superfamily acetyltransferase